MTNTIVYFISIYYVHSVKYGCPAGLTKVCLRPFGGMHQDFWQAVCLESVRRLGGVKTFWGYRPHCGAKRQRSGSRGCAVHQRGVSPHCMGAQRARSAPKAVAGRSPCAWSADGLQSRFRARSAGHQVSRSAGRQAVWGEVSRSAGQQVSRSAGGQVGKIDTNQADTPREGLIQRIPRTGAPSYARSASIGAGGTALSPRPAPNGGKKAQRPARLHTDSRKQKKRITPKGLPPKRKIAEKGRIIAKKMQKCLRI